MDNYSKARSQSPQHKKALALPIVLFFMLVSQLLYMGLIRLNQMNGLHHQLFQQHFQGNIQETMAWYDYNPVRSDKLESLEVDFRHAIVEKIEQVSREIAGDDASEGISEKVHMIQVRDNERLLVTYHIEWRPVVQWQQQWELEDWSELPEIEEVQQQWIVEGYSLEDVHSQQWQLDWRVPLQPMKVYEFYQGEVTIEPQQSQYMMSSQLATANAIHTTYYKIEDVHAVLHATFYSYIKNIDLSD